jgi:hypothetical protein
MGTDLDSALDEIYYGRHCRHNGGIPASLGARTSYDIKYAHQRLLKRQEVERLEHVRKVKARKRRLKREAAEVQAKEIRQARLAQSNQQIAIFERRRDRARSEVSLWQEDGWEAWWELLQLASRKWWIQQADYNETGAGADTVRYLLLQAHLKELAHERGFPEKTGLAVAASIFVQGFASWSLVGKDRPCTVGP